MAQLSSEQQQVLSRILKIGRQKGASPKQIKAAIETGLVESNLRNLAGGDADSAGWRQERASLYANPTNLNASIGRFFDETAKVNGQFGRAGDLAAAVQRPATQYRGRYQQNSAQADALMRSLGGQNGSAGATSSSTTTRTIPGVDNSQQRRALTAAYIANPHDPSALAALAAGLLGAKDAPARTVTTSSGSRQASSGGTGGASGILGRANAINAKHLPYQWGGGHQANVKPGQPLDCSGAVSRVLGVKAKVAKDFESWGKPGKGSNVTVYAKDSHVLMSIRGKDGKEHFWGTSQSNPGGGAGWISKDQISPEYLSGFVARHPEGQFSMQHMRPAT